MAVFAVFELKGGWIQGLGRIFFKEVPFKGDSITIAGAEIDEVSWYEVLCVELTTDATSAGNIVLALKTQKSRVGGQVSGWPLTRALRWAIESPVFCPERSLNPSPVFRMDSRNLQLREVDSVIHGGVTD